MAQVIWNKRASKQFSNLQNYIAAEFGENAVISFTSKTFKLIELLLRYPQIGSLENPEKVIRGFVLHEKTTLLYKEHQGNIYILSVFDNRQDPKKKL